MLESVVERLLSRYLAQYVRGISRDKLSVAVWSGNVELEDLQVKPEVSDILGIPFRVVWGRVQKIKLTIPWSRLGTAPVCVEVAGLHVLLHPKPIPEQSDEELIQQLRQAKRRQVEACELQMHDARLRLAEQQHQHAAAGSSSSSKEGDGGFFFRFVNKILSNLLVDIRDVHVALVDPARGFSVGVLLNQASIHNTDAAWRRHEPQQQQKHQAFYKACELSGLAIYCALDGGNAQQPKQLHRTRQQQKQQEHPFPQQPKALHAALPLPTFPPPPPSEPPPLPSCPAPCGYRTAAAAAPSAALAPSGEEGKQGGVCTPPIAVPPSTGQGNEGSEEAVERQLLACEAPPCPSIGPTVFFGAAGGPEGGGTLAQTCEGPSGEAFANRLQPVDARGTSQSAAGSAAVTAGAASNGGRASGGEARGGLTTGCGGGAVVSFAWPRSESGGATGTRSQYVLKPLHLRLTLLHAPEQQELEARLEVLRESQGIEISRSHLEALLAISNEAAQRRQRCEQLLLRQAHTVMLGTEGLEGKTQREFIGLYSRQLQAEAGVRGVAPLTYKEQQRLLTLHDVVGVRHLAKWRNICTEATNRVLQQTQLLQQQQQQQLLQQQRQLPRQQQQSWWQWVTGRQTPQQQQQQQQQQQEMPKAAEGAQTIAVGDTEAPLLTSEDIQLIVDAVQSDELMQSVSLPTKYVLTFELEQFSVCLKNDNEAQEVADEETADVLREAKSIKAIGYSPKEASKCFPPDFPQPPPPLKLATAVAAGDPGAVTAPSATASIRTGASDSLRTDTSAEKAFLSVELFNLCAALDLLNRQDAAGRDSSEWSFCISLSNVAVRQQSHLLMHFRRENAAAPAAPVAPAAAAVLAAAESPRLSSHCRGLMMFGGAVSGENELSLATSCSRSSSSSGSSSSSSSSSSSWRCSSGSSSSWSFSRSSTSAVAFSPAEATASCLTAARLELRHDLTPTGNILGVYIRLSPLVAAIKPELVRTLCDFFVFETPADVRRLEEEEERRAAGVASPAAAGSHWAPCGAGDDGKPDGVDSSGSSTSKVATEVGDMRKSEFVEGLRETGETVYEAAVQHLPDLVQLDLLVAAPILNLDGKGAGSVALHLGTLSLRSDGACPYDALRGVLEVNETRLICAPTGHQEVSILRPIPIRVQLEVFKMKDVRLNILFEEIFLELTPEAIGLLIAVPASMAKSLLQERPQQVTTDRQQSQAPTTAATAEQSGRTATRTPTPQHLDPLQDAGGQGEAAGEPAVGFSATKPLGTLPAAAAEAAEAANAATEPPDPVPAHLLLDAVVTGPGVQPDDFCSNDDAAESEAVGGSTIPCGSSSRNISSNTIVDTEERSQLVFASIWRFGRCGFLVRGLADRDKGSTVGGETGPPVLQAELTDLQMQLTADLATGKCGAAAELHQVLVSDPSTDSPLFLSLQNNVELATSRSTVSFGRSGSVPLRSTTALGGAPEEEEFHDAVEDMEKSLRVELEVLLGKYNATTVTSTSATASPTPAASAAATTGADGAAAGAAAAEACVAAPKATLVVTSLPVELHWRQQSLRRILQTLEVYRETIRGRVQLHLDELSEASAAALGPRGLLSKETVAAVHDTLQTVQQTLSFRADGECMQGGAAADAQRSSSTKSRSKSGNAQALRRTTTGRDWLRTGLDLGSVLPPLAIHRCCDTAWKVSQEGTADRAAATAPTAGPGGATGGGAAEEADAAGIAGESQEQLLHPTVQRQVPHVGLELTLTFREVAVAFWETNEVVLARMALKELKAFSRFYSNGDTETTFAIGDGGVVFRDRCVLAPRAAYRPPSQQQPRRHTSAAAHDTAKMEGGASYPLKGCDIAAAPEAPGAAPTAASSPGITGAVSGTQRTGKGAPAVSLFTARLRQYGGPDPISAAPPPYSMCLEGQMEQICFVYRQQDVSRTLNYLRDGIFDVFISKSYRAVKEAATASYCLFALDIQSPLFILAEDKDAIPGYVAPPGYRMPNRLSRVQKQSAAPAAATPTACPAPTSATDPLQMEVEVGHLGRFIVFDLGNLKMHNAYMPAVPRHHPHQEQEHQEQPQHEFIASRLLHPPSFGDAAFASVLSEETRLQASDDFGGYRAEGAHGEVICSDLRLEMRGMQISASDNTQEPAAGGCLLENVEARMLLRSAPTSLSIEAETTAWLLHLSRQQLTLVFDVINENIGGQGYAPASEVPPVPPAAAAAATDSSSSGGGGGGCLDDAALRRELEAPPLAVECHIVIPQLTLEASYGAEAPLALLSLHRITAKAAVSVSRLVSCYRFLLYAEEFSIDDLRASSANYFKRVAHCTAPGGGDSRRVGDRHCCGEVGENLPGGSQGEEESDASEFVDTLQRRSKVPGVQFEFGSSLRESYMDFQFSGVTVYLLLVAFMDILSYFTSSWAFSSMRSYPKPLPTLLKNAEQQHQDQQQLTEGERVSWEASRADKVCDSTRGNVMSVLLSGEALRERPFRVSVIIRRGCFVVYSALQSALAPIIVWSSDFLVHLIMKGDEIAFERVKVTGSKICRFNSAPPPEAPLRSQSHAGVFTSRHINTGECSVEDLPGHAASSVVATQKHGIAREGSAAARTVRWGSTDVSSNINSEASSNRQACRLEFSCSPRGMRQHREETAAGTDWKQQERHMPQQMMRDWAHMQQLQQLHHFVSGRGPSPERLAPRTDPSSAVLLCEQFHLEGRGVYRSACVAPEDRSESSQQQQQGQAQGNDQAATTPHSHDRIPAAVHRMQQAFSAAAAQLPPSSISPPGGRRAPPLSSGSAAAAPKQSQRPQPQQQQREVGTDGPQKPDDQRRLKQKQRGKQAPTRSALQQQCTPMEQEQVGASAQPRVATFIDMSFDIPLFFLRVSCRDMALLLAAAQGLHSDGPSVCPPQQPPPICLPEACARRQQRQQQEQKQEDADIRVSQQLPPLVERTAKISLCLDGAQLLLLDDLRSSVLPVLQLRLSAGGLIFDITSSQLQVALRDFSCGLDYLNAKAGCWEPFIEKLDITAVYRRDYAEEKQQLLQRQQAQVGALELLPGEDPWGSFKAAKTLMLHSQSPFWLNCTPQLCDLFAWFLPYLLAHLTEGGVPTPDSKGCVVREGPRKGCLSPSTVARDSLAAPSGPIPSTLQLLEGDTEQDDDAPEPQQDLLVRLGRSCSEGQGASSAAGAAPATTTAAAVASMGREVEAAFRYLNLTGECHYAFTMHKVGGRNRGVMKEQSSRSSNPSNSSGKGCGLSSSRIALRGGAGGGRGERSEIQTVDGLLLLLPGSSSPLPLDGLLQSRTAEASRRSRNRQRFYITNCPPVESVLQLREMFPSVSVPAICRSIMSTQDVQHTLRFLTTNEEMRRKIRVRNLASASVGLHRVSRSSSPSRSSANTAAAILVGPTDAQQQQNKDADLSQSPRAVAAPPLSPRRLSEGCIDPSPPAIGPFPRGTKAVAVDSMRNCCVTLLPPVRHSVPNPKYSTAPAAVAALRGPTGTANAVATTTERFLGGSSKGVSSNTTTVSSSSSSNNNKFAARQLQRLRSSLTMKDRRPSGAPLAPQLSHASTITSANITTAGALEKRELWKQRQEEQQEQQHQQQQQQGTANPTDVPPQEARRHPTALGIAALGGGSERSFRSMPLSGQSIFVDLELWRARGSRGESLQQLSGEHSTISSSFSAPLPLAHVDSTSEAICQVLSPHPSYKLLLLSTTVSVHNSSGMPLEICFLDAELNPLLLPAAHGAYAPLEAIGEAPPCACKRGHLSMEEPSSLHPDLLRVPEWMLLREERWKLVQRRETLQHKEQLKLLQQASAAKSPSLRRTAAAPFRRSLTESGRITGYTKSPTSHGSLQHEKSARDGDLSSESHTRQPAERLTYTFLLPNQHVLSVPQRAILGSGWCNVCFRPAAFAEETAVATEAASTAGANPVGDPPECANSDAEAELIPAPPDMTCVAGWCDMIDTRHRMKGLRCRQSSYLPPDCRPGASVGAAAGATGADGGGVKTVRNLYFLVHIEGRKGALPAEKELKRVTIFPSLTLVNATPTELEVCIAPSSSSSKASRRQLNATPTSSRTAEAALQELHALQQRPILNATLRRRSTFLVYAVPPNRPLRFRMRFAMLEGAEWSSTVSDLLSSQDEVVTRVLVPSRHNASVELEVLHDTAEVIPFLPYVSPRQLVAVIAAPRAFIDRTGLGVRPIQDGRFFPEFDGQSLLGDSATSDVTLLLPRRRGLGQPVECRVSVPALGGYSHATLEAEDRCYTLRLRSEKMDPSETAGAICRVVSLVPEFILTNALKVPLFFRQYGTPGPAFEVHPGQSYPVYWANSELPQAIQFRPGAGDGYAWSGAVVASEETAGKSWIALYNGMRDAAPGVFCVEVAPDGGVKSICIRGVEGNSEGFLVINRCPVIQRVMVHTYHTEMSAQGQSTDIGGGPSSFPPSSSNWSRHPLKLPDFDFHFFANEGETVAYGWPFPFTYTSRPCQVLLWIDSKTVAPKSPIALDLETPQYKRYEVNLGLPDMPQIIVRTEKRGDAMIIEVRPKPGTGPEGTLAVMPSTRPHGAEHEMAAETPLRSLHVAVTMAQVGISLIYDAVREELCFAEMSQLAIGFQERGERQKLLVRIADIQIDNQMERARKPVLLANRGGGGHGAEESSTHNASKPFLSLFVVRHHTTSSDVILRRVQLEVDNLEVEIDADALNGLNDFFWACMTSLGLMSAASRRTISAEDMDVWIESPIHQTFDVYCWCSFVLDKLHMLSDLLKVGLRILMASGRLELMGAKLNFQREEFRNLRGTAKTFVASLQERYTYHLLNSVFSSLGQSSLLNLPRMPFELGKNTIGLAANAVDSVSAGLGSLLSTFTFDSEYINRRQRERGRNTASMRDGFLSAGKNIGEGMWSLTNIVTKPIEGAQREGVGGFFKGIGKGIVGSLVKPLDKVGQAVSDVTRGIKAEVSRPIGAYKFRNERRRKPRMLGELGEIRPYDETEATLRECLGLAVTRRLQKFVTVLKEEALPPRHFVVLFYPKDLFFVDLAGSSQASGGPQVGDESEAGAAKNVNVLWHASIPLVRDIRASTHGVIIRAGQPAVQRPKEVLAALSSLDSSPRSQGTHGGSLRHVEARGDHCYQIPCPSAALISQLYKELLEAVHGSTSVVQLGTWDAERYTETDDDS